MVTSQKDRTRQLLPDSRRAVVFPLGPTRSKTASDGRDNTIDHQPAGVCCPIRFRATR